MKKRQGIIFGVVFIFILFAAIVFFMKNQEFDEPVSKSDFKLNTVVTVTIYDLEGKKAEAIIDKALKLCDKYEKIFSRTLPESEIYELNHGTLPQEDGYYLLSEECAKLIAKGLYYSELSDGAFDITIEPVSSLWDFTSGETIVPDAGTIAKKQACVGYENVELTGNRLRFKKEGMGIELGAVAKGYIADKVKEYLVSEGVKAQSSILEEMYYASEKNRMASRLKSGFRSLLPIGAKQWQP